MKPFSYFLVLALAVVVSACHDVPTHQENLQLQAAKADYGKLLAEFPEDAQGRGIDRDGAAYKHFVPEDQPMTYGLVLSSESVRYKKYPTTEGRRRIRKAADWLIQNSDLDQDGLPGWGLPEPWDAFADGSTNAPNHPYTITTAIVLNGLLDGMSLPNLWTKAERRDTQLLMKRTILHWCHDLWQDGFGGGYFWYSPCSCDANFAVNAPAMFLGSMSRFLREQPDALAPDERRLIESRSDELAKAIVNTVEMRNGAPYWRYMPLPNRYNRKSANDLVHQVYILWGIETYRDCGGRVALPWTRSNAVESLDRFMHDGRVFSLASDETPSSRQKSILWGTGAMLAFYARYGTEEQATRAYSALIREHGPMPSLRLYPTDASNDAKFYPRHAAHALWGMAYYCFSRE